MEQSTEQAPTVNIPQPALTTPPDFTVFNQWLRHEGYTQIEADEWDAFQDDGAFDDATPDDLQPVPLIELFLEWRGSDQQQARVHDNMVHEWNWSRGGAWRPQSPLSP